MNYSAHEKLTILSHKWHYFCLVFNESANTKIALCTYLNLTLIENRVGWAQMRVLRESSIAHGLRRSRQSRCRSNTKAPIT